MRPQRLPLLWQRSGRPGSFYAPTLHEPAYLLARVSGARPNQHRHRLLQATAFCILLQPPPRKRTQPVLQSPSQITVSIHAFTQAACAGRAGLSPKRHTTNRPKLLFAHSPTRNRTAEDTIHTVLEWCPAVTLFLSLSSSLPISAYLSLVSPLSLSLSHGALPLLLSASSMFAPSRTPVTRPAVTLSFSVFLSLSVSCPRPHH